MQQFLKPTAGPARAWIVSPELFQKFLVPVYNAISAFDAGFRREPLAAFTRRLETEIGRGVWAWFSWHTSNLETRGMGLRIIVACIGVSPAPDSSYSFLPYNVEAQRSPKAVRWSDGLESIIEVEPQLRRAIQPVLLLL